MHGSSNSCRESRDIWFAGVDSSIGWGKWPSFTIDLGKFRSYQAFSAQRSWVEARWTPFAIIASGEVVSRIDVSFFFLCLYLFPIFLFGCSSTSFSYDHFSL
ncbi:hypothetical protein BT96DRAFT_302209 [Gymnopus androsaceus JB14]|uniref:Uncharacterized protein n=1 Tax=Gymnopus androsaceus JB14 TaxID=1447944 RepID=A0A6A4H1R0_9AGAR|nr:hypothetical protein BT96DRAFT_302209 [Gymnopus androsaceus JB14]